MTIQLTVNPFISQTQTCEKGTYNEGSGKPAHFPSLTRAFTADNIGNQRKPQMETDIWAEATTLASS